MNKEIAKEIITILKDTKAFAVEQLPDIASQVLEWNLFLNKVWIVTGIFTLLLEIFIFCSAISSYSTDYLGIFALSIPFIFFGFLITMYGYIDSKKIEKAPKLYLLEYFSRQSRNS